MSTNRDRKRGKRLERRTTKQTLREELTDYKPQEHLVPPFPDKRTILKELTQAPQTKKREPKVKKQHPFKDSPTMVTVPICLN